MRKSERKTVTNVKDSGEAAGAGLPGLAADATSGALDGAGLGVPAASREALDQLFSATYEELRRLASAVRRGDPSATLSPTALVNEAWLKMARSPEIGATSRLHFKRIAARAMRQLLVEAARRRNADKRGGGAEVTVLFEDAVKKSPSGGDELLALDHALETLADMNPRQAVMVESRFFGGLDIPETAAMLDVSEATVLRDWRAAKAWLANELRKAR
jgi:RNA polymerase sigma factor (TIGR02999 family)